MSNGQETVSPNLFADTGREERIREKAYQLWEEDGSPDGKPDVYWHRAREIIEKEAADSEPPEANGVLS
jgi:Protein of unknown function (DUF2934)